MEKLQINALMFCQCLALTLNHANCVSTSQCCLIAGLYCSALTLLTLIWLEYLWSVSYHSIFSAAFTSVVASGERFYKTSSHHLCLSVHRISPVSMVDSVRLLGMTSSATVPLTTLAGCARHVCGVLIILVLTECAVWTYRMVMSVSNLLTMIITLFVKAGLVKSSQVKFICLALNFLIRFTVLKFLKCCLSTACLP